MFYKHVEDKGEWWTGETKDGRSGDFPSVFVQPLDSRQKTPDIICVAFQEIVDLTADNIAKASTKNLEQWNSIIQGKDYLETQRLELKRNFSRRLILLHL